tara:strand:- start:1352 stop:1807 length:456 start_codon:yes stop_codon:yes gene_type:complete
MKIILIQDVENLGQAGDIVNVKNGYARNYLFPNKLALFNNKQNSNAISSILKQKEEKDIKERSNLESLIGVLNKTSLKFSLNSGEDGKLFGSVTSQMISDELNSQGLKITKKEIVLDEPIKSIGNHKVNVNLGADLDATVKIKVSELEESK